jgi:dipeptidyl aminopeptidase/acylaminoacyl peptidase
MSMKNGPLLIFLLMSFSIVNGQKKPLDHTVYDAWQHIGERMISNDGKWVVYSVDPQEGDNELVIQSSDAKYSRRIPRGYNALITEDNRFVVFKIKPLFRDTREARIKKKKADDFPKDSLGLIELGKEDLWKVPRVKTFKTPQKSGGWLAYHLEKSIEPASKTKAGEPVNNKKITDSLTRVIDSLQKLLETTPASKKKKKNRDEDEFLMYEPSFLSGYFDADGDETPATPVETGTDLVLRKTITGEERTFRYVLEYYFSKNGSKLLIEQSRNPKDSLSRACVILYDLFTSKADTLSRSGNDFRGFTMTDDGVQVAYLAERDANATGVSKDLPKFYKLWYFREGMDTAMMLADRYSVGMKLGQTVSEWGSVNFSKSGQRLFFGTSPVQTPKDTSIVDIDMPKLDIWHYNDDYLQTVQTYPNRLRLDMQQNFLAVYNFPTNTIKQLATREMPLVIQTNEGDGDIFVGITDFGKRVESQWTGTTLKDVYAVDVNTGSRKKIKENLYGQVYPSAMGKYIMWYDRKARHYFVWNGTSIKNISEKIKVPLWNEEFDMPDEPGNYGVMGWDEEDSAVYIYDRYDVWKIPVQKNSPPALVISNRKEKMRYRYIQLDPEQRTVNFQKPLFFRAFNENTRHEGLVMFEGSKKGIPYVFNEPVSLGGIVKAKNSEEIILTAESFERSPDLFVRYPARTTTDGTGNAAKNFIYLSNRLSQINPQQSGYLWGTAELFKWKAYNGKEATGIVYKPENFDPKKKYPMICYFYEKLSDGLYDYKEPAPIRSAINVPFFVSRGYIIFMPDIEYKVGYPGQSAYDYIVSGARAIVKKGWADSTRLALQGHSWGGYQAAQLATMTKLFKAVWAGAPVANMTSAYGGIRWESGVNRQFQYEKTQSRIGGSLWEKGKFDLYIKNSPLFHLDKVTAPMVIMANDADGAVPWYQGIELFTGLRRLGKKVWM